MTKKWFQLKEQGAGTKRLLLSFYIYKIFGEKALRLIAFFVAMTVFMTAKERRNASIHFYKQIKKPSFISSIKLFINFGNTLVDKIMAFDGKIKPDSFQIDNIEIFDGAFFITTHIGNIEVLRAMLSAPNSPRANIFLQGNVCETFNNFLKKLEVKTNLETFPVENINPETSIKISERLKNGEIVFMAGDRISAQNINTTYQADFLGAKINLPLGTLKFALLMDCPIYFIVCIKEGKKFVVHTQNFSPLSNKRDEKLEVLKTAYTHFLEEYALKYPYQFYNFYEITD